MKFKYVPLIAITLATLATGAEHGSLFEGVSREKPSLSIGIQGGLSFANAATPSEISNSTRTGFLGGINLQLKVFSFLSLQPELMYVQRGVELISGGGLKLSAETDSVEVPLLVRVNFGERFVPYLFAGPVAVFNLANRLKAASGDSTGGISYNPRAFDIAADAGVGMEFESLFINLRYSLGLLQGNISQGTWQSRGFQLLLGFNLGV